MVFFVHKLNGNKSILYFENRYIWSKVSCTEKKDILIYHLYTFCVIIWWCDWTREFYWTRRLEVGEKKSWYDHRKIPILSRKKSSPVLFCEQRGEKGIDENNRERTRLSSSVVREHGFMFRISSFLEVALINRFRVASKWRPSLIPAARQEQSEKKVCRLYQRTKAYL